MSNYTRKIKNKMKKACKSGEWSQIEPLLLEHGNELASIAIDSRDDSDSEDRNSDGMYGNGNTALHYIAYYAPDRPASVESIKHLAGIKSVDVNKTNWMPFLLTPLHKASQMGKVHLVEVLMRCGANPNAGDDDGYTPARWCCRHWRCNNVNKTAILSLLNNVYV